MKRLHIFKAGTHITAAGQRITFNPHDLAITAAAYNPARYRAPLVLGHPSYDAPAYGYVNALHAEGGNLFAQVSPSPDLAQMVRDRRYLSVSAAFYRPDEENNPYPGAWSLRHVGFLGASPPAVKGMNPPAFAESSRCPIDIRESPHEANALILAHKEANGITYGRAFYELLNLGDIT